MTITYAWLMQVRGAETRNPAGLMRGLVREAGSFTEQSIDLIKALIYTYAHFLPKA